MSFVERFITLCPYLGESTIGGSTYTVLYVDYHTLHDIWYIYIHVCSVFN